MAFTHTSGNGLLVSNLTRYLPLCYRRDRQTRWYAYRFNRVLYVVLVSSSGYPLSWGYQVQTWPISSSITEWWEGAVSMAIAKRAAAADSAGSAAVTEERQFVKDFPLVWEYLTETKFADGSARATSSLNIFFQDGDCKVCLRDRDAGEVLWATAEGPLSALKVLEGMLATPDPGWRRDRYAQAKDQPKKPTGARRRGG